MSLNDEIKENLQKFIDPMKQAIRNVRDDIGDAISDLGNGSDREENNGCCLWSIIKSVLVVIIVIAVVNYFFADSKDKECDAVDQTETTKIQEEYEESIYSIVLGTFREGIESLLAEETVDIEALEEEYIAMLTCRISEYMFKSMAYYHFMENVPDKQYQHIIEEVDFLVGEMKQYIPEESVNQTYTYLVAEAYRSFDDTQFDYDAILIGSPDAPDIDAMWEAYFCALIDING
jgi:translation elongation factor EF-G